MADGQIALAEQFDDVEQQKEAATLGMWTFLATEVLFFGGLSVLNIIIGFLPFGLNSLGYVVSIVGFVGWIILMINGFQGKYFKLPVIGDYAEKYANQGTI